MEYQYTIITYQNEQVQEQETIYLSTPYLTKHHVQDELDLRTNQELIPNH